MQLLNIKQGGGFEGALSVKTADLLMKSADFYIKLSFSPYYHFG